MSNGNNLMIDLDQSEYLRAKIKVIGVGGAGCNAIGNMIEGNLQGVELIAANTDSQALKQSKAMHKVQLGLRTTKGLGAGSDPEIGRKAAEESEQDIIDALKDSEMVFVTCGMGGGTGTGAAPVIARTVKSNGTLVVAIVTRPFDYEGNIRKRNAEAGIEELSKSVDAMIVIPNQKIYEIIGEDTDIDDAMLEIDQILFNSTRGISDIINKAGKFNVDFADVRTIMKDKGKALMGIGKASGENRAVIAAKNAVNSPLLDGISITGATGLLVNISGGKVIRQSEIQNILNYIRELTGDNVNLIHGIVKSEEDTDELSVTVIATGFDKDEEITESHSKMLNTTFKPFDLMRQKPEETDSTASQAVNRFKKQNGFSAPRPAASDFETIPTGHQLRQLDEPAYKRFPSETDSLVHENIQYLSEEESTLDINSEVKKDEIKLEQINPGFDFMGFKPSNEGNFFRTS